MTRALVVAVLAAATLAVAPVAVADETRGSAADIQRLLDAARPGDTVTVPPGTYHGNLRVRVPVRLVGVGGPVLEGDGTGSVITIEAQGTVVAGLVVRGSAPGPLGSPAGVRIEADDVTVRDVVIEDCYFGVSVHGVRGTTIVSSVIRGRSDAPIVGEAHATAEDAGGHEPGREASQDHVSTRGDGISLWDAVDTLVRGNVIENARDGIFMSFGEDFLIDRNAIVRSRYAIHSMFAQRIVASENRFRSNLSGAVMMYGGDVLLLRNEIRESGSPATGFGVLLKDVAGVDAVENVLVGNRVGVQVDGPAGDVEHETKIGLNTIAMNQIGVALYPTAHATFWGNSFVENVSQVLAQGSGVAGKNRWTFEGAGNYWSGYRGYDAAGDGVGDVSHAEGGTVEGLLVRTPVLTALASSPAFSLIRAVEDRWVEREPVALDDIPLMRPHSPSVANGEGAGSAGALAGGIGLAAVLAGSAVLVRFRRPRPRAEVRHA